MIRRSLPINFVDRYGVKQYADPTPLYMLHHHIIHPDMSDEECPNKGDANQPKVSVTRILSHKTL
jgi:hypothetical protein